MQYKQRGKNYGNKTARLAYICARMRLRTTYRQILAISTPIMLGSAAQNVIALSDSVFLFHLSQEDFASIGFVGIFYLVVAAIGYGFSRGGQIIIARRMGEGKLKEVGRAFYSMVYFEAGLAAVMFLFMQYGCNWFFSLIVDSPIVFSKSLEYLETRSWGVFFSYIGVSIIALYTGVARTTFIIVDTIVLGAVNIALDYALIFGKWGLPAMGIAGAGLASTIAEVVAFIVFAVYIAFDKPARRYHLFKLPRIDLKLIRQQYGLSAPIVAQAFVGLGSWFVFFGIVENLGEHELAITNLVRIVYLVLSIPTWGFASGVNTMVSNFIGQRKRQAVIPIIWKTAKLSFATTMLITIPVILFPHSILYPLLGGEDMSIITDAQPVFYVLAIILALFSIVGIYFNGMAGTGATFYGLLMQAVCAVFYLAYIYVEVNHTHGGLIWAWAAEIFYWAIMQAMVMWYLRSRNWHRLEV